VYDKTLTRHENGAGATPTFGGGGGGAPISYDRRRRR